MLKYLKSCLITKKTLVVVAYRFNIKGLLKLNAEAPTFFQVRPVARPRSPPHQWHSAGRLSSCDDDISFVHNSKIKLVQLNICTKKPKLDLYFSRKSRPLDISYIF